MKVIIHLEGLASNDVRDLVNYRTNFGKTGLSSGGEVLSQGDPSFEEVLTDSYLRDHAMNEAKFKEVKKIYQEGNVTFETRDPFRLARRIKDHVGLDITKLEHVTFL